MGQRLTTVSVRLNDKLLGRLDSDRGSRTRSQALRRLIDGGQPAEVPRADQDEALRLLSQSARDGSVQARIAYARLMCERKAEPPAAPASPLDELAKRRRVRA